MQTEQNLLARRRRRFEDPESIIELLKGTPPPMPSGQSAPQVAPVMRKVPAGLDPTTGVINERATEVETVAPGGGLSPDKQKILDMIRGMGAKEPLTTSTEGMNPEVEMRPTVPNIELATGEETRPWKAGYGVGEKDPLKREAARIRAMIENPISKVNPDGSVAPPKKMGRWRAAGLGLLQGIAQSARPGESASWGDIIGGGGAGLGIGIGSPKTIQEWQRRMDAAQAQGDLATQQKLERQRADIEETQAQTEQRKAAPKIAAEEAARKTKYDNERLAIQRKAAEGRISIAEATRKLRESEMEQRKEEGRLDRESREKVAGMPPRAADTGPKRQAKINEASSLYKKADAIDKNASDLDEHIKKLEDGMGKVPEHIDLGTATDPKVVQNPQRAQFISQIEELKKQQNKLREEARGLRTDGDKARSEGEALPQESATATGAGRYAGQRFSRAKVAERAKSLGMTVAQAEKTITDGGGTLY